MPVNGPEIQKQVGVNIKKARKKRMWTQADLEHFSEVPLRTIQRIEDGKGNPGLQTVLKIILALEADPAEIFHIK